MPMVPLPTSPWSLPRSGFSLALALFSGLMMDRVEAEIMVSEVMYHPRPISDLEPEEAETGEFIELLNTGSQTVDLSGFHFDRGITYRFPDGTRIQPGEFLVIARNPVALISESPLSDALGPYLGSLSNSSETIRLNTALDQPLFSFRYQSKGHWPASPDGTGHSLVRANLSGSPRQAGNWTASDRLGGSPGAAEPGDHQSEDSVRALIKKGSIGRYFKGTKEPSKGMTAWAQPDFTTNADWRSGRSGYGYSNNPAELAPVSTRLNDMRGNYLSLYVRIPFDLTENDLARLDQLTLTMHYDDSYIIYLNGERIAASGVIGSPPAFDQNSIAGDDYPPHRMDLTDHAALLRSGRNWMAIQGHNIGLNNSSDFVLAPELDLHLKAEPTPLELIGKIVINELQTNHRSQPDFVEFFNPAEREIDLSGLWLSDKSQQLDLYQIPGGTRVAPGGFVTIPLSQALTGFAISSLGDQIFLTASDRSRVIVAHAFDAQPQNTSIGRFPDGSPAWYRSPDPSPGMPNQGIAPPTVLMTELMYHASISEQHDYLELMPLGEAPIDVSGWHFEGIQFRFPADSILQPGQRYLLADDADALVRLDPTLRDRIIGSYGGSLSNRGERISLLDAGDIRIDTLEYDDRFPWPVTPDGLGSSLERHCLEGGFDQPDSWSASPLHQPSPGQPSRIESCDPLGESSIRISEILYHPAPRTEDDRNNEFVELTNIGTAPESLEGWVIAGDLFYLIQNAPSLGPGESLLLTWNPSSFQDRTPLNRDRILGPYLKGLPNGGGEIIVVRQDGRLADRVRYDDGFPWPSLADGGLGTDDVSLQRICLEGPGDDPGNWRIAKTPNPGTEAAVGSPCLAPPLVRSTGTIPARVTASTEPILFAEFSNEQPNSVSVEYWIDDPEDTGEPHFKTDLNDTGTVGDQTPRDGRWSTTLPSMPANAIVRYRLEVQQPLSSRTSPSPERDAFAWHAYFVDPQTDSNLPNNYHLFISSRNWRALHQATQPGRVSRGRANPRWNDEVPAVFVAEGVVHDVSVRHQGSRWNRKNGGTIDFACASHQSGSAQVRSWRIDFPSHRNHNGMDVILLQKQSGWPQHISFKMFEQAGVPAPRTSWANLRINGCDYNRDAFQIERPGRDLVARWFDDVGDLFKSQGFTGNEGPWSWGDARLIRGSRNGSTEQERYEHTYNRKTHGWKNDPFDGKEDDPQAMIEGLHQARGQGREALRAWLANHFDIDRTLRYICTINYVGTFDDMFQNHYLYKKAEDGKWCLFPWDMDNTLGGAFGETNANPFRGVDEARHGNVGNRSRWWNRIKDSFFIAYETEFLERFHQLNQTVHSPDALRPLIEEAAHIRGLGSNAVTKLMRHVTSRHRYLNQFLTPRLEPPTLSLQWDGGEAVLEWPNHRTDYRLEHTTHLDGPWDVFEGSSPHRFSRNQKNQFFRLVEDR